MGAYTTRPLEDEEYALLIQTVREGYEDQEGVKHKPNRQIATILVLQANLGCRIGDIVALTVESIIWDGNAWKLDIKEEKTKKSRNFIVPEQVKAIIDGWKAEKKITSGRLFTVTKPAVWKVLRQVCAYLGFKDVSSHSFRKAAAMRVYENSGYDVVLTSNFLNHSSPTMTMAYLKRSSKQMDDLLSKSTMIV